MSVFDLIILVILAALTLRGVMKGMVSQIVSVGSLLVCWIVASRFAFVIAPSIPAEAPWNRIGAMIVLFVVTMIAIRFAHGIVEKKIKDWNLSGLNKYLGGGLGFVKGLVLCMVLTFFGVMLSETTREVVFQSKSGRHLSNLIARTGAFIPPDSCELLRTQIDAFNAKVGGTALPEDEDYMQMMMASGEETAGNPLPDGSKVGELLSRGSAVMEEMQSLRNDFERETAGAESLLDAVRRWWSGTPRPETAAVEVQPPMEQPSTEKTVAKMLRPENEPVSGPVTQTPVTKAPAPAPPQSSPPPTAGLKAEDMLYRARAAQPSPVSKPQPQSTFTTTQATTPTAPQTVQTSPAAQEENLFRTQNTYAPPTADELTSLLPMGSNPAPSVASTPDMIDPIASGAMAIPRSSSSFRLSGSNRQSSERLLNSTRSNGSGSPATLFAPR